MGTLFSTLHSQQVVLFGEFLVKSLLLCLIAGVASRLLRRASASARHLVWLGALVGLVLLPWMQRTLPSWQAVTLPALSVAQTYTAFQDAAPSTPGVYRPPIQTDPNAAVSREHSRVSSAPMPDGTERQTSLSTPVQPVAPEISARPQSQIPWLSVGCLLLWLAGITILLAQMLFGLGRILGLKRRSALVSDPEILTLLGEVRQALHSTPASPWNRPVTLRISTELPAPITWGAWRPQILLPAESAHWSKEQMRTVLLHEVAHSVRHDWLLQMLANGICACYWFHPLAWFAARQMRMESERACDDLVLLAGVRASDYASLLLETAQKLEGRDLCRHGAVSMAQPAQIEKRLRAILDTRQRRQGMPPAMRIVVLALGGCLLAALASAQVGTKASIAISSPPPTRFDPKSGLALSAPPSVLNAMSEQPMRRTTAFTPVPDTRLRSTEPSDTPPANAPAPAPPYSISPKAEGDGKAELSMVRWSKVRDGLQLGIRLGDVPNSLGKPVVMQVNALPGGHLQMTGYLRNASKKAIGVAVNTNPGDAQQGPSILTREGKEIQKCDCYDPMMGLPSALVLLLQPGEIVVFSHPGLTFTVGDNHGDVATLSAKLSPGDYLLQQGFGYTLVPLTQAKAMYAAQTKRKDVVGICTTRTLTEEGVSKEGRALVVPAFAYGVDRTIYTNDRYWNTAAPFTLLPEQKEGASALQPSPASITDNAVLKAIAWGSAKDGLEAGIRFMNPKEVYEFGDSIAYDVYVRNVGDHTLNFIYRSSPQFDTSTPEEPTIAGRDGKRLVTMEAGAIEKPFTLVSLKPGDVVKISQSCPRIGNRGLGEPMDPIAQLPTGDATGLYTVRQSVTLFPMKEKAPQAESGDLPLIGTLYRESGPPLKLVSGKLGVPLVSGATHAAWGKAVNGLQAGLSIQNDRRRFKIGDAIPMSLYLRNVSKQPIEVWYMEYNKYDFYPTVVDSKGEAVSVDMVYWSIYVHKTNRVLNSGETVCIGYPEVPLVPVGSKDHSVTSLPVKPGKYRVSMQGTLQPAEYGQAPAANGGDTKKEDPATAALKASPISGQVEFEVEM